jgi:hypothetical protein
MKTREHEPEPVEPCSKRTTRQPVPWCVCARCGLVYLKNDATKKAARAACPGLEDQA